MGPQCRLGIYVGFDYPSIIRYLERLTGDIFKVRFEDCHFDEIIFPSLGTMADLGIHSTRGVNKIIKYFFYSLYILYFYYNIINTIKKKKL
jgi:hypothetical protein